MRHLIAAFLLAATFCASTPVANAESLLINAARVYRDPETPPIDHAAVLIRDGKIAAVGKQGSFPVPEGTRTSECAGGVVTAGFQNSHMHFTDLTPADANQSAEKLSEAIEQRYTRYGFTTLVDTTSDPLVTNTIRKRIERGEVPGPRILTAGFGLFPENGLPIYIRDLPPELLAQLPQPATVGEALAVVRKGLDSGADVTKLFLVTPQARGEVKRMSPEIAAAAARETHQRGKLVLAHPTDALGIRAALDAGVDVIVHTTLDDEKPWDAALVKEMVRNGMSLVPTLTLWRYELQRENVPAPVMDRLIAATLESVQAFAEAGGQILFGTDAGYMPVFDTAEEYVYMSRASLTPMQILASLTTAPAARWKESQKRGRVDAGMEGDLVVLRADPTADVKNFADVRCVFRAGQLLYSSTTN